MEPELHRGLREQGSSFLDPALVLRDARQSIQGPKVDLKPVELLQGSDLFVAFDRPQALTRGFLHLPQAQESEGEPWWFSSSSELLDESPERPTSLGPILPVASVSLFL